MVWDAFELIADFPFCAEATLSEIPQAPLIRRYNHVSALKPLMIAQGGQSHCGPTRSLTLCGREMTFNYPHFADEEKVEKPECVNRGWLGVPFPTFSPP